MPIAVNPTTGERLELKGDQWVPLAQTDPVDSPLTGGLEDVGKAGSKLLKGFQKAPVKTAAGVLPGAVEAVAGGIAGMGVSAGAGARGLAEGVGSLLTGGDFSEGFKQGYGRVQKAGANLPLEPETKAGKFFSSILNLIPTAFKSAGEATFKGTGSPALAAGVEGVATLLSLKPGLATDALGLAFKRGAKATPEAKAAQGAFDDLVKENPTQARDIARKAGEVDAELKKELDRRIDELTPTAKDVKAMPKKAAEPMGLAVSEQEVQDIFNAAKHGGEQPPLPGRSGGPKPPPPPGGSAAPLIGPEKGFIDERGRAQLKTPLTRADVMRGFEQTPMPRMTPQQASADLRNTMRAAYEIAPLDEVIKPAEPIKLPGVEGELPAPKSAAARFARQKQVADEAPARRAARLPKQQEGAVTLKEEAESAQPPKKLEPRPGETEEQMRERLSKTPVGQTHTARLLQGPVGRQRGQIDLGDLRDATRGAFNFAKDVAKRAPGFDVVQRNIEQSVEQTVRSLSPETLGPDAKAAAAALGSAMAKQIRNDTVRFYQSEPRRSFWNQQGPAVQKVFRENFDSGRSFGDPALDRAAAGYRAWADQIATRDTTRGIKYDIGENYLRHSFLDGEGAMRFLSQRHPKLSDPQFLKAHSFELIADAERAGFKLKASNPEELMLAREHASNIATTKIEALQDMEAFGVARKLGSKDRPLAHEDLWESPTGERYAVRDHASQVLHNAFNTRSLWAMEGPVGTGFRAMMLAKNTIVPFKLMSLFHPIHVATMQGADALVTSTKGLAADNIGVGKYAWEAIGNQYFKNLIGTSVQGYRLRQVWQGKVPEAKLTQADRTALQWMTEGGFAAELSPEFRTNWTRSFKESVDKGHLITAGFKLPFTMLENVYSKPIMEVWIPSLKTASYVNAAAEALRANPELLNNRQARMEAFRKLQKSVDNRFGEMQYTTTFMNRTVKDIGVGSLLSLGWQLGFLREYGGAVGEAGRALTKAGEVKKITAKGDLDKALFVTFYTTQAMMLGGLMTYALTGETPQSLLDYIFPRNGEKDPDGTPQRVSTPYYTREFMAVSKHVQQEGLASGMAHLAESKLSPAIGTVRAWATNLDYFGHEISDPNAPLVKQLGQKVAYALSEMEPIATSAARRRPGGGTAKDIALSAAGFAPAPKYATVPTSEALIRSTFMRYHKTNTPYEKAEYGQDNAKLRAAYLGGDADRFAEQLEKMQEKYHLSSRQMHNLRRNVRQDPVERMFKSLSDEQQLAVLKKMPSEEKEKYLTLTRKSALGRALENPRD